MTEAEIANLEDARCQAMINGNVQSLGDLLAESLVWIHSTGKKDSKTTLLQNIERGGTKYFAIDRSDVEVRKVAMTTFIVSGQADMDLEIQGSRKSIRNRYTNVWIVESAGPRMVAWQSASIPS